MRARYEVYCEGRLLRVIRQEDVTPAPRREADGSAFVDGEHYWMVDEGRVADDVAQAMLARWGHSAVLRGDQVR